ncbi:hypothetical protein EMPG_13066 [Blastomyces silverae]|uniref:Uncharacterized protein n=1 Tax=Blastomyces silverae TaxID=2060906 RepID=A0A0H1BKW7_9EURO|nr:hypothetical protein EMPG_13066 [Blastomyces silverae]
MGSRIERGDQNSPEGNEDKDNKVPNSSPLPSLVSSAHCNGYYSCSGRNMIQGPDAPYISMEHRRILSTTELEIRRSSQGPATIFAPDFSKRDLVLFNPRSAIDAERHLPPLDDVLDQIATDVKNCGFPCFEYPANGITQHLNNMLRRLPQSVGTMGATRGREIMPRPDPLFFRDNKCAEERVLPPLYVVVEAMENDIERVGFPPIVHEVDSTLEYLVNMAKAVPAFSHSLSVRNYPRRASSYRHTQVPNNDHAGIYNMRQDNNSGAGRLAFKPATREPGSIRSWCGCCENRR